MLRKDQNNSRWLQSHAKVSWGTCELDCYCPFINFQKTARCARCDWFCECVVLTSFSNEIPLGEEGRTMFYAGAKINQGFWNRVLRIRSFPCDSHWKLAQVYARQKQNRTPLNPVPLYGFCLLWHPHVIAFQDMPHYSYTTVVSWATRKSWSCVMCFFCKKLAFDSLHTHAIYFW